MHQGEDNKLVEVPFAAGCFVMHLGTRLANICEQFNEAGVGRITHAEDG